MARFWFTIVGLTLAGAVPAAEVRISESLPYVDVPYGGTTVRIERIPDTDHKLTGGFAKTSRKCPPFCIHPMRVAPGVTTVGELELLDFLLGEVQDGTGLLIDALGVEGAALGMVVTLAAATIVVVFGVVRRPLSDLTPAA